MSVEKIKTHEVANVFSKSAHGVWPAMIAPPPFFQRKDCRSLQSHGGRLQSDPIGPCASNGLKWFLLAICYLLNITFQFVQLVKIFY